MTLTQQKHNCKCTIKK